MSDDDANDAGPGECPGHEWVPDSFHQVETNGVLGMAIVNACKWCDAVFYEPSNVDRFPDSGGVNPRLRGL